MPPAVRGAATGGPSDGGLARHLCQVVGLNQNLRFEGRDSLPHPDRRPRAGGRIAVLESEVRRVNVIVYANYGEPNARIIYGRDNDFDDRRSQEHNRFIAAEIGRLSLGRRRSSSRRRRAGWRGSRPTIREYHQTKSEEAKKAFEEANTLLPVRVLAGLDGAEAGEGTPAADRTRRLRPGPSPTAGGGPPEAFGRPPRRRATESGGGLRGRLSPRIPSCASASSRSSASWSSSWRDLDRATRPRAASTTSCSRPAASSSRGPARASTTARPPTYTTSRLEMTRNSLMTTWRQVQSRLGSGSTESHRGTETQRGGRQLELSDERKPRDHGPAPSVGSSRPAPAEPPPEKPAEGSVAVCHDQTGPPRPLLYEPTIRCLLGLGQGLAHVVADLRGRLGDAHAGQALDAAGQGGGGGLARRRAGSRSRSSGTPRSSSSLPEPMSGATNCICRSRMLFSGTSKTRPRITTRMSFS